MKKKTLFLVLCVAILAGIGTLSISCTKQEITKRSQETTDKKTNSDNFTEKVWLATGTVTILPAYCGPVKCAPGPMLGFTRYNRIKITKDAKTIAVFQPNMRYTIYALGSHLYGTTYNITKIDEFFCDEDAPEYGSSLLANSTTYYVMISDGSQPTVPPATGIIDITMPGMTMLPFTTGNGKDGLPC